MTDLYYLSREVPVVTKPERLCDACGTPSGWVSSAHRTYCILCVNCDELAFSGELRWVPSSGRWMRATGRLSGVVR